MDCREWEAGLDELLEGRCDDARRAALEAHAAGCPRCGALLALARGDADDLLPTGAPDLTAAVLARTTGPACGRAARLLAGLPDGAPALADAQLLQAHLDHCAACRALADTLAWLSPELRAMAEIAPDPAFAADVMTATAALRETAQLRAARRTRRSARAAAALSGVKGPSRRLLGALEDAAARLGIWWRRQVQRPLFALEFAYVATMLAIVLCATPISPLRHAPERALAVVKASPDGVTAVATWTWKVLPAGVTDFGRDVWAASGGRLRAEADARLDAAAAKVKDGLTSRAQRTQPYRAALLRDLGAAGRALVRFEFVTAATHWNEIRADLRGFWSAWRAQASAGGRLEAGRRAAAAPAASAEKTTPNPNDG